MGEQGCLIMDDLSTYYSEPQVEDYGTLTALTEAFDPDTLAHVAKGALSLAVVSTIVPGGGILPGSGSGGGGGGTPGTGVMGENRSGGGGTTPGSGGGGSGGAAGAQGSGGSGGSGGEEVLGAGGSGGGSGSGGRLPFTGFSVILMAALGAALAGAGARARSVLRRKRD